MATLLERAFRPITEPRAIKRVNNGVEYPQRLLLKYGAEAIIQVEPRISVPYLSELLAIRPLPDIGRYFIEDLGYVCSEKGEKISLKQFVPLIPLIAQAIAEDVAESPRIRTSSIQPIFAHFPFPEAVEELLKVLDIDVERQGELISRERIENTGVHTEFLRFVPGGYGLTNGSVEWEEPEYGEFHQHTVLKTFRVFRPMAEGALMSLEAISGTDDMMSRPLSALVVNRRTKPEKAVMIRLTITDLSPYHVYTNPEEKTNEHEEHDGR